MTQRGKLEFRAHVRRLPRIVGMTRMRFVAEDDDDDFWQEPGGGHGRGYVHTSEEIVEVERVARVEQTGLLDRHGEPLVRYVTPVHAGRIGFGAALETDAPDEIACITTESELRVRGTQAGSEDDA